MLSAALYARVHYLPPHRTRDRGCSAHPAFPAPSVWRGGKLLAKLGRIVPRDREGVFFRHCERSEAIHRAAKQEWIASSLTLLAMTGLALRNVNQPPRQRHLPLAQRMPRAKNLRSSAH